MKVALCNLDSVARLAWHSKLLTFIASKFEVVNKNAVERPAKVYKGIQFKAKKKETNPIEWSRRYSTGCLKKRNTFDLEYLKDS